MHKDRTDHLSVLPDTGRHRPRQRAREPRLRAVRTGAWLGAEVYNECRLIGSANRDLQKIDGAILPSPHSLYEIASIQ